jgi:acrylyl-CoA reductase (NADPH)
MRHGLFRSGILCVMSDAMPATFPAFVATKVKDAEGKVTGVERGIAMISAADLPAGDVTIRVRYSSVNYKDALATLADGGVTRLDRLVPGIDLAGEVVSSTDPAFTVGQQVIANGGDIGVARDGGYSTYTRLPADVVIALPGGLTMREAMAVGTAGFTAAESVHALELHGLKPGNGPVLVTGATGGVGSTAVGILARRGYEVVASTGKPDEAGFLKALGASEVIDRSETSAESKRPLEGERWAGAVDCVGGSTLAYVLRTLRYGCSVAASGLTGGTSLPTTVLPFILRGVNLLGIDSVTLPMHARREIWHRCATDLKPIGIDGDLVTEIGLDGLDAALTVIRVGGAKGRFVVKL